ncbi:SIS domain-containing protein [Spiroplasma culicicola]|uniref:Tagatose-6-phosphate ketose/aldose isomerase n=1 Tax=Spiroplasma culicicola AES-1 TaxID=1276246 RepID=W6A810_9MOLU|nr:SIS domain-containing protein [Spiroplasma culicicola]AHI53025.1 tagatose-6-phosphate ketose/aldose isomerase [Spiroplasma culicicola AES-1]
MKLNEIQTYKEIKQQPVVWKKILKLFEEKKKKWVKLAQEHKEWEIIFVGAGTSEFVGNAIERYWINAGLNAKSYSSTEIVADPNKLLKNKDNVIFISFARSGNSPESLAAVEIANKIIKNIKHIYITCNSQGKLALQAKSNQSIELFLLPDESNDLGFAMTSSYSGMMIAACLILSLLNNDNFYQECLENIVKIESHQDELENYANQISNQDFERLVYLGSGEYKGFCQEAHLKFLELTQGNIPTFFNDVLAFRHGPKSILNEKTIVFLMASNNEYTRKYDLDMIKELETQKQINQLIVLDNINDKSIKDISSNYISLDLKLTNSIFIGLSYIYIAQIIAVLFSLKLNINPDNPCPTGEVNRVVQGVVIYKFDE